MLDGGKQLINKELSKEHLIHFVLEQYEHKWISENFCVRGNIEDFLQRLPRKVLQTVFYEKMTILTKAEGRFSSSITNFHQNEIMIYPEVYELLAKNSDGWAKAVMAHEVGHLYLDHAKIMDDPMEAKVDADTFTCELGYLDELENYLHDQAESVEKRVRLSFVTSFYFANNHEV